MISNATRKLSKHVLLIDKDLNLFPNGDLTAVGERGVSLSGGQKARINLARSLYVDADIYLMDDPLSAVDTHVGRHLFDKAINGYLRDKIRVLVTHQLQYLKDVNQLVMIIEAVKKIGDVHKMKIIFHVLILYFRAALKRWAPTQKLAAVDCENDIR
jgi:ABC-type bacteriocin/lantibiotic exporter with double-glycine peptidase domain